MSEPVSRGVQEWGAEAQGGHHPAASPCMSVTPPQLCMVLNDVELLRKAAGQALRGLAWPEGAAGLEGTLPRPLLSCTQALDEDLQREARTVTAHLTSKVAGLVGWGGSRLPLPAPRIAKHLSPALPQMVGDVRKYVQHVSLSPDSIQNDEVSALPAEVLGSAENARVHWGPVLV